MEENSNLEDDIFNLVYSIWKILYLLVDVSIVKFNNVDLISLSTIEMALFQLLNMLFDVCNFLNLFIFIHLKNILDPLS